MTAGAMLEMISISGMVTSTNIPGGMGMDMVSVIEPTSYTQNS